MFLLHINDLPQAVVSDSLLYADDTCIVFQHKSETEIEKELIRDFLSLCDWFVDNKSSTYFGQDKQNQINIEYNGVEIKQRAKVKYLGCILDESLW